ncbi:uncharacterized protein [Epargyreus clarus]|uniref:uncharacterized protein n=1 Tax=Epargyreus clarus TaxID=520877 RepID=UPI003C2AB6B5
MHNWRLLILLIPCLLQPILSEHSFLYGRQYCIHSSRSTLADERFLHGQHRFGKPTSNSERLVVQLPTDQREFRRYRYDVRDVEPKFSSNEQQLDRRVFASDDRKTIVQVRRHSPITNVNRNVETKIIREQNHKNFRNARDTDTSLYARLPDENRERKSREISEHRLDTRLDTRRSHIRHTRQDVSERNAESNTARKNNAVTRNFRHEHILNRQSRDVNRREDNVRQMSKNTVDSSERNIRKRNLDGDSIRDNARAETSTDRSRERVNIRNIELNIRQHDTDRVQNRNIIRNQIRVNSRIESNLDNRNSERNYRANVRERAFVSDERNLKRIIHVKTDSAERFVSESGEEKRTDIRSAVKGEEINRINRDERLVSRNNIRERGTTVERDMHQSDSRKIDTHSEQRTDVRNSRDNIRDERYYQETHQHDTRRITDKRVAPSQEVPNNNVRYERPNNRNFERHSRDIDSYRSISADREVRNAKVVLDSSIDRSRSKQNSNVRVERISISNDERYSREHIRERAVANERDERQTQPIRLSDVRSGVARSREEINTSRREPNSHVRVERIQTRNDERYSRKHIRERSVSNDHDVRQTELKRVSDVRSREARSREEIDTSRREQNSNIRVERIRTRNDERYSREHIRERSISNERDERQTEPKRISDVRSRAARSREEINTSRREQNSNVRVENIRTRNDERYSREQIRERSVSNDRDVHQTELKRVSDVRSREARSREEIDTSRREQNSNIRVERIRTRNDERYSKEHIRERSVSNERDERQTEPKRISDVRSREARSREEINTSRREQNSNVRVENIRTRNDERYSREHIRERPVSNDRDVRQSEPEKVSDVRREGGNQRYSREHIRERAVANERDERQTQPIRLSDVRSGEARSRQETNTNRREQNSNVRVERIRTRNDERYSREHIRERAVSNDRDVRQTEPKRVSDVRSHEARTREEINVDGSRSEQNSEVRAERIRTRHDERYSREHIRERAESNVRDERRTQPTRLSDVRSLETRSREEINASQREPNSNVRVERIRTRNDERFSREHIRERAVSNDRDDIRKTERYSREGDFNERQILRSDARRNNDENYVEKRNVRTRVERTDLRYVERYVNDNIRERSLKRDVRQHDMQRMTNSRLTRLQKNRNTYVSHERADLRYSEDNTRDRSVSMDREIRESNLRRVSDVQNHRNHEERNIRNRRTDIRNDERYLRATRERTNLIERSEDIRHALMMRNDDRQITRRSDVQNRNVRQERSNVRYNRDDRVRDRTAYINDRELRESNGQRILRNQIIINDIDKRSYSRFREQNFRDSTNEMTYPRFGHIHRISQEQTRNRDYLRSSDARVPESRTVIAMRSSTTDTNRERETGVREGYRSNMNMRRDYTSRQNSEFTNALKPVARTEPIESTIKETENQFSALFYWQYFFYAVQGIYILGVLIQVFKEKEHSKTSSMAWLSSTRLVKVD